MRGQIVSLRPAPAPEHLQEGSLLYLPLPFHHDRVAIDRLIEHGTVSDALSDSALPEGGFEGELRGTGLAHNLQNVMHDLLGLELVHGTRKGQVPYLLLRLIAWLDLAFLGEGRTPALVIDVGVVFAANGQHNFDLNTQIRTFCLKNLSKAILTMVMTPVRAIMQKKDSLLARSNKGESSLSSLMRKLV